MIVLYVREIENCYYRTVVIYWLSQTNSFLFCITFKARIHGHLLYIGLYRIKKSQGSKSLFFFFTTSLSEYKVYMVLQSHYCFICKIQVNFSLFEDDCNDSEFIFCYLHSAKQIKKFYNGGNIIQITDEKKDNR